MTGIQSTYVRPRWTLTATGARRLAAARRAGQIAKLPESPQHRRWRQAREAAEERYDAFRTLAFVTLEAAENAAEPAKGADSGTWFALGDRVGAAFWLMGSVTYCLRDWPEPDDADADHDDARPGRSARRNFEHWRWYETLAGEGCP